MVLVDANAQHLTDPSGKHRGTTDARWWGPYLILITHCSGCYGRTRDASEIPPPAVRPDLDDTDARPQSHRVNMK